MTDASIKLALDDERQERVDDLLSRLKANGIVPAAVYSILGRNCLVFSFDLEDDRYIEVSTSVGSLDFAIAFRNGQLIESCVIPEVVYVFEAITRQLATLDRIYRRSL